jgi:hypothetical protein
MLVEAVVIVVKWITLWVAFSRGQPRLFNRLCHVWRKVVKPLSVDVQLDGRLTFLVPGDDQPTHSKVGGRGFNRVATAVASVMGVTNERIGRERLQRPQFHLAEALSSADEASSHPRRTFRRLPADRRAVPFESRPYLVRRKVVELEHVLPTDHDTLFDPN